MSSALRVKSLVRLRHEFVGDGQVDLGRTNAVMAHEGGKMYQPALDVHPFPVPLKKSIDGERMPQVIETRAFLSRFAGNIGQLQEAIENTIDDDLAHARPPTRNKEWIGWMNGSEQFSP